MIIDAKRKARRRVAKRLGREYLGGTRDKEATWSDKKTLFDGQGCSWRTARKVFRLAAGTLGVRPWSMCSHPRYQAAFLERIAGLQSTIFLKNYFPLGTSSLVIFYNICSGHCFLQDAHSQVLPHITRHCWSIWADRNDLSPDIIHHWVS